tara:strand:- start:299 stop:925 length:627 start_codon:yes stop_codon:yes gene_type:complete
MDNFNAHKWFKNQYLKESDDPKIGAELEAGMFGTGVAEGEGGGSKSQQLAIAMNNAMVEIDDSMSYKDFAEAVASILINEYGSHNFGPFMEVLHTKLGMKESLNENDFKSEETALAREIDSRFGGDSYINMGKYAGNRPDSDPLKDKGYGTITFKTNSEFEDREWAKVLNFVKSKGFEITDESNYYDFEPNEREWFPKIDFTFNATNI